MVHGQPFTVATHTCSKDDQPAEEVLVAAAPHVRLPGQ